MPQCAHWDARTGSMWVGARVRRWRPGCPACPPGLRPVGEFGGGRLNGLSLDGGFEEFDESSFSRASSFASRSSSAHIIAACAAIVAACAAIVSACAAITSRAALSVVGAELADGNVTPAVSTRSPTCHLLRHFTPSGPEAAHPGGLNGYPNSIEDPIRRERPVLKSKSGSCSKIDWRSRRSAPKSIKDPIRRR